MRAKELVQAIIGSKGFVLEDITVIVSKQKDTKDSYCLAPIKAMA